MFESVDSFIMQRSKVLLAFIASLITILLGIIDHYSGIEISFSVTYLIPVLFAAWYINRNTAFFISLLSSISWLLADLTAGHEYSHSAIPLWNGIARLTFFLVVTLLLSKIKIQLLAEEKLADTDPLTGLANRRSFLERARFEQERSKRYKHPFTIAYIDLDNFKSVNDVFGHEIGDTLLCSVADSLRENVRQTDIISRLGGDEFAILFSETGSESAKEAVKKTQKQLIQTMKRNNWPVTFSIGVVSFEKPIIDIRDMLKLSDDIMYKVKKSGKNKIEHSIWPSDFKQTDTLSSIKNL